MADRAVDIFRRLVIGRRRRVVDRGGLDITRRPAMAEPMMAPAATADDAGGDAAAVAMRLRGRRQRRGHQGGRGERDNHIAFHGCSSGRMTIGADDAATAVTRR